MEGGERKGEGRKREDQRKRKGKALGEWRDGTPLFGTK